MNKEYEEMGGKLTEAILLYVRAMQTETGQYPPFIFAREILALETPTLRIAVVKKEPELPPPRLPNSEIDAYVWEAQQDMIKANYVQEVKSE